MSAVAVAATESVTAQRKVAVRSSCAAMPAAVNDVVALDGLPIVIESPLTFVHA